MTIDLILRRYFPPVLLFAYTVITVRVLNGANYTTKIYKFSYILFCIGIIYIDLLRIHFMYNCNVKWILSIIFLKNHNKIIIEVASSLLFCVDGFLKLIRHVKYNIGGHFHYITLISLFLYSSYLC